jgi:hypothetical protein
MPASLGGAGNQFAPVSLIDEYVVDLGRSFNGQISNPNNAVGSVVLSVTAPLTDHIPSTILSAASGGGDGGTFDDGNGAICMQLGGGLSGDTKGQAVALASLGILPQLLKQPAGTVFGYPLATQAWMVSAWIQFGPVGTFPNRGDVGLVFEIGEGRLPDVNGIHNINQGGATNQTGPARGFGVLAFADGNLHLFSNIGGSASVPGVNQILCPVPLGICQIDVLIQNATPISPALLTVYVNKKSMGTFAWSSGAGRALPLYTDQPTAGQQAGFTFQVCAYPAEQDSGAFSTSGLLAYALRWRRGPLAQVLAGQ